VPTEGYVFEGVQTQHFWSAGNGRATGSPDFFGHSAPGLDDPTLTQTGAVIGLPRLNLHSGNAVGREGEIARHSTCGSARRGAVIRDPRGPRGPACRFGTA